MNKHLVWSGPALDPSGYGEASRNYLVSMHQYPDWLIKLRPKYFWTGDYVNLSAFWDALQKQQAADLSLTDSYIFVQHLTPNQYLLGGGACRYHIGMTTFETDGLPPEWIGPMRTMDELWTFSNFNKQVFEAKGVNRPITVIPHGVDTDRFRPGLEPLEELRELKLEGRFVFGSVFDWTERKNPGALIRAYYQAFKSNQDPVALVIKTFYQYPFEKARAYIRNYIAAIQAEMKLGSDRPPIYLITRMMDAEELPRLYNSFDAFVLPSRGEGAGLPYLESLACELPVIATAWSGQMDFLNEDNSYLLKDYKLIPIVPDTGGTPQHYVGQNWADCSVEELAGAMRAVSFAPAFYRDRARRGRQDMVEKYTWSNVTQIMIDRLNTICAGL